MAERHTHGTLDASAFEASIKPASHPGGPVRPSLLAAINHCHTPRQELPAHSRPSTHACRQTTTIHMRAPPLLTVVAAGVACYIGNTPTTQVG